MTKVPWKGQETSSNVFVATKAGQCVSVDQMILSQVGFIAQLNRTLTKKCYTVATVFVDHYSRLKYIHLMTKLTSEETMEAKQAALHPHPPLPLQQRTICRQCLQKQLQCKGAATHLL
jgi:hypothetical protein